MDCWSGESVHCGWLVKSPPLEQASYPIIKAVRTKKNFLFYPILSYFCPTFILLFLISSYFFFFFLSPSILMKRREMLENINCLYIIPSLRKAELQSSFFSSFFLCLSYFVLIMKGRCNMLLVNGQSTIFVFDLFISLLVLPEKVLSKNQKILFLLTWLSSYHGILNITFLFKSKRAINVISASESP